MSTLPECICPRCGGRSVNFQEDGAPDVCGACLMTIWGPCACPRCGAPSARDQMAVPQLCAGCAAERRALGGIFGDTFADVFASENGTSTNSRVYGKTQALRDHILKALGDAEPPVTVRQLFYLVEARHGCSKDDAGYRRVQRQVLAMRREGLIDYGNIADNSRYRIKADSYDGIEDFFEKSRRFYRQDLWARSDTYVECWCEKDAIAGVLSGITGEYDVPLLPARGYSSETFAYEAAEQMKASGKRCFVYYVGDFDPSGWDASRDLERRLKDFHPGVTFERLGVNFTDIEGEELRTRPSKKTDTRAKRFFQEFGDGCPSAELEAMHPDELRRRVRVAIEQHVDPGQLAALKREEAAALASLEMFAARSGT